MTSTTHISFGLLMTEFIFTSLGITPSVYALALGGLGALLPDIDTPKSAAGRVFPFAGVIEQKYGHRQITHSWLFIMISLAVFAPLAFFRGCAGYAALVIGVTSHIMIDMANPSGVPFFWPDPARFVFPRNRASRIEVGTKKEFVLLAILLSLALIFTPVTFIGYKSLFNRLAQDIDGAVDESKKYSDSFILKAGIKGIWKESQVPVDEDFTVLAVQDYGLIVERADGRTYYVSRSDYSAFLVSRIDIKRAGRLKKAVFRKECSYCLFDSVTIPRDSIVSGYMFYEGYENIKDVLWSFGEDEYRVMKLDPKQYNKLILSYCPSATFEKLKNRGLFISYAALTITQISKGGKQ